MEFDEVKPGKLYVHHANGPLENESIFWLVFEKSGNKLKYRTIMKFKEDEFGSHIDTSNNSVTREDWEEKVGSHTQRYRLANRYEHHFLLRYIFGEKDYFEGRK